MLDPKLLKEKPQAIRDMLKARNVDFDLDGLIEADQKRREFIIKTDEFKKRRNEIGNEISQKKKAGEDTTSILAEMKNVSAELAKLESQQEEIEPKYSKLAFTIPNLVHESVPVGPDDTANKEIRKWGEIPQFDFKINDHIDMSENLDLVDLERAAKVAGARFYYLKNDLVRLNQSLIHYALDFLTEKEYSLVQPPYMINRASMEGAVIADDFEEVIYKVEDEDLYMIGTSEHAMAAMHSKEIIEGKDLPIKYAGVSPCFRKEAGAHGRDQKGIFRVHQFDKIEQFVFARPEDSWKEHEKMLEIAEEFYQKLEIPHRVMLLSTGDLGKISAKTYDIEAWMAGQNSYREIVSCSNCLDYQARRLKIRFRDKTNEDTQYLHTLNSTLVATTRVLVSIMENFQTKDGHIKIPRVLQSYMGNQKEI
ncbi:Serine--tRNA ligase protein [Marine Group I thaumarchaeote SCGC AAA799-E16]|uniref:Serine--tRNA ligase n=4 Tax=Marine Group I TaxID=905826 RepID=A0A081RLG6_9ARCH|nr:Serine--tRNA ligase protein [Marine Group I thaumarchaeote SCGC AAA799-N04]KER05676.1 Serine--tRNA ligase protein [Marine Group I thaumarchaeote SCGC AAA799-E16]KFM15235.1 Serine--tRNA ligase protein [Marine Group I thaumarchaeote SCGC AAA799-D11]KFM16433.1 Serine--tRNA ligase protein [Marine Group I thaumarchaeote SCGC RSA3]